MTLMEYLYAGNTAEVIDFLCGQRPITDFPEEIRGQVWSMGEQFASILQESLK